MASITTPIALILGAWGRNVDRGVASKFKQEGYKVAVACRNPDVEEAKTSGFLPVTVNVQDTASVSAAFRAVHEAYGHHPNVVVFNSAPHVAPPTHGDPLSLAVSDVQATADIQVGLFAAAKEAVAGFRELATARSTLPNVFIFTGNSLPFLPATTPPMDIYALLGWQKRSGAFFLELFAASYLKEGFRFYFADQNKADGGLPGPEFSGEAHGLGYWNLVQKKEQGHWYYRFGMNGNELPGRDKL